jgi:hypothetical protein
MQTGRHGIYAAVLGNAIYLPGGSILQGFGTTGVNEAYVIDLAVGAPRQPVILTSPRARPTPRVLDRE